MEKLVKNSVKQCEKNCGDWNKTHGEMMGLFDSLLNVTSRLEICGSPDSDWGAIEEFPNIKERLIAKQGQEFLKIKKILVSKLDVLELVVKSLDAEMTQFMDALENNNLYSVEEMTSCVNYPYASFSDCLQCVESLNCIFTFEFHKRKQLLASLGVGISTRELLKVRSDFVGNFENELKLVLDKMHLRPPSNSLFEDT